MKRDARPGALASAALALAALALCPSAARAAAGHDSPAAPLRFSVSFSKERSPVPSTAASSSSISKDGSEEPRMQVGIGPETSRSSASTSRAGSRARRPSSTPRSSAIRRRASRRCRRGLSSAGAAAPLRDVPPRRRPRREAADGPGRGAALEPRAGKPAQPAGQRSTVDPGRRRRRSALALDPEIPPIPDRRDTRYVKHVRIHSERLTKFWGRPMELGAVVLLPEGFDEHPEARYPLVVFHGHFPGSSTACARRRPTRPLPEPRAVLARLATTVSSRSRPTSSTRTGRARGSRG